MKAKSILLFLLTTTLLISSFARANASAPSFDCKKAHTSVDQLICQDNTLSYLNFAMTKYYENAKKILSPEQQKILLIEQSAWLKDRSKLCQIPDKININNANTYSICLRDAYQKRNYQLFLKGIGNQPPVVTLTGKLSFAPFDVTGKLSAAEIQQLYTTDLISGDYKTIYNCKNLNKYNDADNNMEVSIVQAMSQTCKLLDILNKAKSPAISYIKDINVSNTQYLDLSFLPSLVDDDNTLIKSYQKQHLSMNDLIKRGVVKITQKIPTSLAISFNDNTGYIDEIARGDFLGKGVDSILVSMLVHSNEGTMWDSQLAILTRDKNDQDLKVVWSGSENGD